MHLLSSRPGGFVEDDSIITRLDQTPADMVVLSSADTTLSLLADAYRMWLQAEPRAAGSTPTLRLANLLHLRQSASLDLYIDEVLQHARLVIVDHLGAESTWPYGIEQLQKLARRKGQKLAMFSGDNQEDPELLAKGTLEPEQSRALWQYLRAGGLGNAREFLHMAAAWGLNQGREGAPVRVLPPVAVHVPQAWLADDAEHLPGLDDLQARWTPGAPVAMLVFYRSHLLAANTEAFDAMADALLARGLNPLPLALESLKDGLCLQTLRSLCITHQVQIILNTTAFAALGEHARTGEAADALAGDIPVLQVIASGSNREDWLADSQGLRPRDIAMQVVLPEMDGRIMTRAMSFKGLAHRCELTQTDVISYQAEPDRIAWIAELAWRWCQLRSKPAAQKKAALILANYPGSEARMGSGVGLDTPESVIALLDQLARDGWQLGDAAARPDSGLALMGLLQQGIANDPKKWPLRPASQGYSLQAYQQRLAQLPGDMAQAIAERWGAPEQDPMLRDGWFMIAGLQLGHVFVGIQPARSLDGRNDYASYHDAELVPPHHYLAFYFWLRDVFGVDAMVHVGKHGNLEWLPGKSLALSQQCWPDAILGPLPHVYPFIVNDPGEGAQAKRRSQAVIIDHLMPPLTRAENHGPMQELERLVDEYYEALLVDLRRSGMLRKQILDCARQQDLLRELGLEAAGAQPGADELLLERIDAYLCELKETQIRDGLHIFGSSPQGQLRESTLLSLARYPGNVGSEQGLLNALTADLLPAMDWNPLDMDAAAPWNGPRPAALQQQDAGSWRHGGDTRERLELLALQVIANPTLARDWPHTLQVLTRIEQQIAPSLDACGPQELLQFSQALQGRFVPPGPSGSPSRGRCDTLPTGRNFYTVDTRAIPTQTAWALGQQSAQRVLERYLQEHGEYPQAIGLSVWGTATMRTGGDDIAQAFALIGVRPKWAAGSQRVTDFEVIPAVGLRRPRVDVTLRISGFFRDAFPNVVQMFDAAVRAVAELDEDAEDNPIRARVLRDTQAAVDQGLSADAAREQALWRVFGAPTGSYGASMHEMLRSGQWTDAGDFARHYLHWGAYAYGQQADGVPARAALEQRLQTLDVVLQNQDSREHDLLDSSEYYQHQGGMVAAVRHLGGSDPAVYHGDHGNPQSARIRSLAEEIGRVVRARVTNPKWIAGAMRHGYKGGFEMAATVDYLFGFDATTALVSDQHYAMVTQAYVEDESVRQFLRQHNPQALGDIVSRLLEAIDRGMWEQPGEHRQSLLTQMLEHEEFMEGQVSQ
ncbi:MULTISPECIES: cobaltochelatase subunit CobN [Comamonas]|uniref:cobaltochelatase subunit CobN n=1 Tax=Comamonas TaxID=283 RepID=UPI00050F4F08|nr:MULTISPECIES: cobaltochelatase subunit CobN [Comamonas]KGG91749.1 cobaltochelatase subunit CobN [Comamonas thiooxydans]KGG95256.1 cobaltochelatase subunit CobN [Comamonas thiooxydans]KGH07827.1 cobaltochelatase subunit CobN [Comamonas thiooxydans]KGH15356.1 cobaltochelatase subunit CobN [Comamonas thiooxydans]TZG07107.1 cobaltochelatase subunit CobN [Comamonas thiooxydans]